MKKYILAHDTGTGGNKAILCNLNGKVLYSNFQPYGISYPHPEWVEQDPDKLWKVVAAMTRKVIQEPGIDPDEILGVRVSAQMRNTLPINEKGKPYKPIMDSVDDLIGISKVVESNLKNKHRYDDLYHENRELYTTLIPVYRRLYQAR